MSNQDYAASSVVRESGRSRNWSLIIGRVALVWAVVEASAAGLASMSGGSLLGISEQHLSLDALVAALVGIGFVLDGSARRLTGGG